MEMVVGKRKHKMTDKTDSTDDFALRRQAGKQNAGRFQEKSESSGKPLDWFEDLYDAAQGDVAKVPWAGNPHKALVEWLSQNPQPKGLMALDVGCGLGDNALALHEAGYKTTAFDVSNTAVEWAKKRHKNDEIAFQQADLFNPPSEWIEGFDFVHETYTIQALKGELRAAAFEKVAQLVKPGGSLLVICRSIADGVAPSGPPWPISPTEVSAFDAYLSVESFEEIEAVGERTIPHFRILYKKKI